MKTLKSIFPYCIILTIIILAVISLIWMDYETESWAQVFGHNMWLGLLLYGLPMFIVVSLFYWKLKKHLGTGLSIVVSALGGIPFTTALMVMIYLLIL